MTQTISKETLLSTSIVPSDSPANEMTPFMLALRVLITIGSDSYPSFSRSYPVPNNGNDLTVQGMRDLKEEVTKMAKDSFPMVAKASVVTTVVETIRVYSPSVLLRSDDYPYGRERATAFFSVEWNNKGCRSVFQTINPKNGRLNAPKKSIYSEGRYIFPCYNETNGHCETVSIAYTYSFGEMQRFTEVFQAIYPILSQHEVADICLTLIAVCRALVKNASLYYSIEWETMKPFTERFVRTMVKGAEGYTPDFATAVIDAGELAQLVQESKENK